MNLRRPPTLSVVDVPFVPEGGQELLDEIEERWQALRSANPAYFDGRLYHVLGVHRNGCGGATMHVADCAYRYHAVQDAAFDLGVRPLGIKGITLRGGRVLVGRRSEHVASYPGRWEFAPGGVVEPGEPPNAQPGLTAVRELAEETGWTVERDPIPIALLYDDLVRCWEIVFSINVSEEGEPTTTEYSEVGWCAPDQLPDDMTPIARRMIGLLGGSA